MSELLPTITFRGMPHSDALEAYVRERITWLDQFHPRILRCHVVIEVPHRHRHEGRQFHVAIEIHVPGADPIVVAHEASRHGSLKDAGSEESPKDVGLDQAHRHARVAVREAFDATRRRLEDVAREHRGAVKAHEAPAHGRVAEISHVDGFGFIEAGEARVYFARDSVLDGAFDALRVDSPVAFVEEKGEKGPQASTVRALGKHHYVAP
jgi:cold shock CspA family protein